MRCHDERQWRRRQRTPCFVSKHENVVFELKCIRWLRLVSITAHHIQIDSSRCLPGLMNIQAMMTFLDKYVNLSSLYTRHLTESHHSLDECYKAIYMFIKHILSSLWLRKWYTFAVNYWRSCRMEQHKLSVLIELIDGADMTPMYIVSSSIDGYCIQQSYIRMVDYIVCTVTHWYYVVWFRNIIPQYHIYAPWIDHDSENALDGRWRGVSSCNCESLSRYSG